MILTRMTTKTPMAMDSDNLIIDITTNLWSDAFLAWRGGISTTMNTFQSINVVPLLLVPALAK